MRTRSAPNLKRAAAAAIADTAAALNGNGWHVEPAASAKPDNVRGVILRVPLDQVEPWPGNPRKHFDAAKVAELAASIRKQGLLVPLLVRPTYRLGSRNGNALVTPETFWANPDCWATMVYELADGERRLRALRSLGGAVGPIQVDVRDLSDRDMLEVAVTSADQREDISVLEKAEGYRRLVQEYGATVEEVAATIGKSPSTVRDLLRLQHLPDLARQAVAQGQLPASTASLIARLPSPQSREQLTHAVLSHRAWGEPTKAEATKALKEGAPPLSHRGTKQVIQERFMVELKQAPFSPKDESLVPEAGSCQACPKRAGNDPDMVAEGVRADVCTDPPCFAAKLQAQGKRVVATARATGKKVLTGKEAKGLFWEHDPSRLRGDTYVDLATPCYEAKGDKTWKSLVGTPLAADVVIAVDPKGQVHELLPRAKALAELKKQLPKASRHSGYGGNDQWRVQQAREAKERRTLQEIGRRCRSLAVTEAARRFHGVPGLGAPLILDTLRALAEGLLRECWAEIRSTVAAARDLEGKRGTAEAQKGLEGLIASMDAQQVLGLMTELVGARHVADGAASYGGGDAKKRMKAFFARLGVKWDVIEKEVRAEQAARQKKPAAAAKNGKATPTATGVLDAAARQEENPVVAQRLGSMAADLRGWRQLPLTDLDIASVTRELLTKQGVATIGDLAQRLQDDPALRKTLGETCHRKLLELVQLAMVAAASSSARPPSRAPITRATLLLDLLPSTADRAAANKPLMLWGLITVGDLLDHCNSSTGPPRQRPYVVLRAVKGIDVGAANRIADALIDAGLTEDLDFPPTCWRCVKTGEVVEDLSLLDAADDLVPCALLEEDLVELLGMDEDTYLCGGCLDAIRQAAEAPPAKKKPKRKAGVT